MKTVLAILGGLIIGGAINMALVTIGPNVIPIPDGVDPQDIESLKENIHRFEPKHFLFPFLAHALGTLVGAAVAVLIAGRTSMLPAYVVGVFFLVGGVMMAVMLPAPNWVEFTDLSVAYIPMALLGGRFFRKKPESGG